MHSVTIQACSRGSDFCQVKCRKNTAHTRVTTGKGNNSYVNTLFVLNL
jgi:hypothetical protein